DRLSSLKRTFGPQNYPLDFQKTHKTFVIAKLQDDLELSDSFRRSRIVYCLWATFIVCERHLPAKTQKDADS
ncbi:MAG: hypothetical protein O2960_29775, partial [Verrucomicrobia bacterium]|nr:hypothetical protein [Verrucomicrobiota bacterium]